MIFLPVFFVLTFVLVKLFSRAIRAAQSMEEIFDGVYVISWRSHRESCSLMAGARVDAFIVFVRASRTSFDSTNCENVISSA